MAISTNTLICGFLDGPTSSKIHAMSSPSTLRPKEQVIEEFGVSIKYTLLLVGIGAIVMGIVLFIRFFRVDAFMSAAASLGLLGPFILDAAAVIVGLMGVYLIGLGLFFRVAYHYYLTTERVIASAGFFSQRTVSAEYETVSDLIIRQDAIGHLLLGTGTLGVNTFGGQPEEVELANIDDPTARREQLRGLAEVVQEGRKVTPHLFRDLKRQRGMLASNDDPDVQAVVPSIDPTTPTPMPPMDDDADIIEDLKGDGVDDSDRLRAAQKKLGQQ